MTVRPIRNMVNHETNEVFFEDFEVPAENLIGEEGQGLPLHPRRHERRAHPDRRRVHRRRLLVHRSRARYANERIVFDRPIGRTRAFSSRSPAPTPTSARRT